MGTEQPRRSRDWVFALFIYLAVAIAMHGVTIWIGLKEGGIVLAVFWMALALPFFIPASIIGAYFVYSGLINQVPHRIARFVLGTIVVALPIYEWHLLGVLPSGWRGS